MDVLRDRYAECGQILGDLEYEFEQCSLKQEWAGDVSLAALRLRDAALLLDGLKSKLLRAGRLMHQARVVQPARQNADADRQASTRLLNEPPVEPRPSAAVDACSVVSQPAFEVVLAHSPSPAEFYVHAAEETKPFEQLSDAINGAAVELRCAGLNALKCAVSERVLARYSVDSRYYRGLVGGVDGDNVAVTFVDYGNGEVVSSEFVLPLPAVFVDVPKMAIRCTLAGTHFTRSPTNSAAGRAGLVGVPSEQERRLFADEMAKLQRATVRVVQVRADHVSVVELVKPTVTLSSSGRFVGIVT